MIYTTNTVFRQFVQKLEHSGLLNEDYLHILFIRQLFLPFKFVLSKKKRRHQNTRNGISDMASYHNNPGTHKYSSRFVTY